MPAGLARHIGVAVASFLAASSAARGGELKDPYFGEALYYAHQQHYFDALERLDAEIAQHNRVDEPHLDSLHHHIDHAEFSVGDFELNYRMHHRAGRAIKAVLEGDVDESVVLDNLAKQTGLTFEEETRRVRVLLVERDALDEGKEQQP